LAVVRPGNVERALDALNFFLADVRDGLGPYLAIYLLTEQKWDEASIGVVMSVAALAGIGAGIFGALFPLVVADLTRGTGHFNISQGAIATAAGGPDRIYGHDAGDVAACAG
jgi:hypothetical protein